MVGLVVVVLLVFLSGIQDERTAVEDDVLENLMMMNPGWSWWMVSIAG